ncbi:MAG: hypothetical protein DI535_14220 [Citrobacter freundii]|nr:MAG: hypothetical protein DI535_14220 [Citrobacter freundii]
MVCAQITAEDSIDPESKADTVYSTDTLLPFHGRKSLNLHGYESRIIPYNSKRPLYVAVSYQQSSVYRYEYFRVDSSTYLFREYFRSAKGSSNNGLKSSGHLSVHPGIADSSKSYGRPASGNGLSIVTHYFPPFLKQGVWEEYQDSLFCHRYLTGNYKDNKRVGIWNEFIYRPGSDNYHLSQRNYDIDSTATITTSNLAGYAPVDTITALLQGRWMLGCEDDADRRMQISKCEKRGDGSYGDDCNDRFGNENHYELRPGGLFKRQKGETCKSFKQNATTGKWRVYRTKDELFLEIKLSNAAVIIYKIWYLDREGSMLADRL